MRARAGALQRLGGARDVAVVGARQRAHDAVAASTLAIALTASKSPLDDGGETGLDHVDLAGARAGARCAASRRCVIEAPGDCSPSRSVVSKMISLSAMVCSFDSCADVRRDRRLARGVQPPAPARAAQSGHDRLERRRGDAAVDADAEQRCARRRAARCRRPRWRRRRRRSRARGSRARGSARRRALCSAATNASIGPLPAAVHARIASRPRRSSWARTCAPRRPAARLHAACATLGRGTAVLAHRRWP